MKKRHEFLKENKDIFVQEYNNIDTPIEKAIINKLSYPYYYETLKKSKIDKYIENIFDDDTLFDLTWDYIINVIQEYVNWFNKNEYSKWIKNNKLTIVNKLTESTSNETTSNSTDEMSTDEYDDDLIQDGPVVVPIDEEYN